MLWPDHSIYQNPVVIMKSPILVEFLGCKVALKLRGYTNRLCFVSGFEGFASFEGFFNGLYRLHTCFTRRAVRDCWIAGWGRVKAYTLVEKHDTIVGPIESPIESTLQS